MSRWDDDDPADEHDIRELRKALQQGKKPQLIGKPGKVKGAGFCGLITLALVAIPIAGAVGSVKGVA